MESFANIERLTNCAVASDGGSIYLCLEDASSQEHHFTLNRSISARGTPAFNQVTEAKLGILSPEQRNDLMAQLIKMVSSAGLNVLGMDLVADFAQHLKEPAP